MKVLPILPKIIQWKTLSMIFYDRKYFLMRLKPRNTPHTLKIMLPIPKTSWFWKVLEVIWYP